VKPPDATDDAPSRSPDLEFVRRVLAGDEQAAADLRTRYDARLKGTLCRRGASATEAEDLVADVWSDCFGAAGKRLLARYQGRCALSSWLISIATNRFIDSKRRQSFRGELPRQAQDTSAADQFDRVPGTPVSNPDEALIVFLRRAMAKVCSEIAGEDLLMLKLVHIHEITQREIGLMWGWHESKVSRTLDGARQRIRNGVLSEIRRTDPWLVLNWDDFLELARCAPDLLTASPRDKDAR
jgi:RNA polymerase sigma factor (sigma-70 family)